MLSDPLIDLLNKSMEQKRGVTLALSSTTVAMVVTQLTDIHVIGHSQQHDRIVVRIDRIEAAYQ